MEEILFLLDPPKIEMEQKLELQSELSTSIRTDLNKDNSDWKYKPVKGVKLYRFRDRIYVPKTLCKQVIKWCCWYFEHLGGDRLAHTLTTICRYPSIVDQARKLYRTCKDCQKFKNLNAKYGLLPDKDSETLTPWHTVCADLIVTYTILDKVKQPDNKYSRRNFN